MLKFPGLFLLTMAVLLGGCATIADSPDSALRARASAYYDALIAADYRAAYGFFTPGYRAARSFQEHSMIVPPQGRYRAAVVGDVRCVTEQACDVLVSTRFEFDKSVRPIGGMVVPIDVTDRWVFVEGGWYLAPRR